MVLSKEEILKVLDKVEKTPECYGDNRGVETLYLVLLEFLEPPEKVAEAFRLAGNKKAGFETSFEISKYVTSTADLILTLQEIRSKVLSVNTQA